MDWHSVTPKVPGFNSIRFLLLGGGAGVKEGVYTCLMSQNLHELEICIQDVCESVDMQTFSYVQKEISQNIFHS
jgi:hypothetical protein